MRWVLLSGGVMSYCRWGEADVYIYDDVRYGLLCCLCPLNGGKNYITGYDYSAMLNHVAAHRSEGDYIPDDVDKRLVKDMAGDHGA